MKMLIFSYPPVQKHSEGLHCLLRQNQSSEKKIQPKLFITSLVLTEYSIFNIKSLGTDLFLFKFPLYNRIFT